MSPLAADFVVAPSVAAVGASSPHSKWGDEAEAEATAKSAGDHDSGNSSRRDSTNSPKGQIIWCACARVHMCVTDNQNIQPYIDPSSKINDSSLNIFSSARRESVFT